MDVEDSLKRDLSQGWYLEHQGRKLSQIAPLKRNPVPQKRDFVSVLEERRSERVFISRRVESDLIDLLLRHAVHAPSSCNRQAISVRVIREDIQKRDLDNYLVGGKGWLGDAPVILLLYADMVAYKSPDERPYMPYLDAGVMAATLMLAAKYLGLGTCYVNPNIREQNRGPFNVIFTPRDSLLFCGAVALGYYNVKAERPPVRETVLLEQPPDRYFHGLTLISTPEG